MPQPPSRCSAPHLWLFALLAVALSPLPAAGQDPLPFPTVFAEGASGRAPEGLAWRPDGELLAFFWAEGEQRELWGLEAPGGPPRRLIPADLLPAGCSARRPPGGCTFAWSPDGGALLFTAGGDLFLHDLASGRGRRLTETAAEEEGAAFSPRGDRIAFVREANLHLLDLATGREEALTSDGRPDEILNGTTDWVYWEEIWSRDATGFWWRPDGGAIAFYRFDVRQVGEYPLLDYGEELYPRLRRQRYPHPGGANAEVRIGILDLASREIRWLATGDRPDAYLVRAAWSPDGRKLAVQRLDRGQDRLDLLFCSPADGACALRLTERWPTWVNLGDEFRHLADGGFLWGSDRDGWRRLYRYPAEGDEAVRLVPDGWAIESVAGLAPGEEEALAVAYRTEGLGPAERQVLALPLDGAGGVRQLTSGRGWHGALAAPRTGLWVERASDADAPRAPRLRRLDGAEVATLPFAAPEGYDPATLPQWKFLTIPGPGASRLPARMLLPPA
ncbi:MAG TPA: DPP IV N-terminal domain-containing protein, partial [Thermoanaerobaculia bacterium]|nr:DPP IV N-terminal domain-containing protein [Thermoanaerobaculia bacterium]